MRLLERLCLVALCAGGIVANADPVDLEPFRATYNIQWKGMSAGTSTLELKRAGADTYHYSSTNTPRGVFRMALPDSIFSATKSAEATRSHGPSSSTSTGRRSA